MAAKFKLWNSVEWLRNGTISFKYASELVIACLNKSYIDLYRERALHGNIQEKLHWIKSPKKNTTINRVLCDKNMCFWETIIVF